MGPVPLLYNSLSGYGPHMFGSCHSRCFTSYLRTLLDPSKQTNPKKKFKFKKNQTAVSRIGYLSTKSRCLDALRVGAHPFYPGEEGSLDSKAVIAIGSLQHLSNTILAVKRVYLLWALSQKCALQGFDHSMKASSKIACHKL
jgi:hypothetical protein